MRKKHAASGLGTGTMCGHETTVQEYRKMRGREATKINCKHCLFAMGKA